MIRAFFLSVLFVGLCTAPARTMPERVKDGILFAPEWKFIEDSPLILAGQWEVIWGELVGPTEFDARYKGDLVTMPGRWNNENTPGFKHSRGVATYRMRLKLPPYNRDLAFHLISPNAVWRLYVDDVLVGGNGAISNNPKENHPNYTSRIFPARAGQSVLVLQLANFSHAYGGPGHPITLWDRAILQNKLDSMSLYYVLVLGILFSIGLFHLIFYLADRRDKANGPVHLWFSLLCFIIVIRISGIIPYFHIYYPESPYWSDLKIVYFTLYAAPGVYLQFFRAAFPDYFPKKLSRAIIAFCFVMAAFVLVTPESIYTYTRNFSIALNVAAIFYSLVFTIAAMRHKQPGAAVILVSNFIFFLTALNDAVIYTDHAYGFDMTPFGVLVLGLGYSYALMLRLQGAFLDAKQTSHALAKLNLDLEKQVHDRTRAFKAAAARAENSALEGAQFIAAASHDLRQPLHALAMFNSALRRKAGNNPLAGLIEKQGSSIKNLGSLLQDTLDTAHAETKSIEPTWRTVDVSDLFEQIANDFDIQAEKRHITLTFQDVQGTLVTDQGMLQRVLRNLIDNAVKAARSEVVVRAQSGPNGWTFNISDDGAGVAKEDVSRIFESYVSLRDEEPGAHGGYGLGLYVVNEFTRQLGGKVTIAATSNTGSDFQLSIPHHDHKTGPALGASNSTQNITPTPGMRILAIDDEPDILDAMQALLSGWQCSTRLAYDLDQAMAHIASGFTPDLLLVDFHLFRTDGLRVVRAIRQAMKQDVPAIIITGATEPSILDNIRTFGLHVLPKPIDPDQLAALLRAYQDQGVDNGSDQASLDGKSG